MKNIPQTQESIRRHNPKPFTNKRGVQVTPLRSLEHPKQLAYPCVGVSFREDKESFPQKQLEEISRTPARTKVSTRNRQSPFLGKIMNRVVDSKFGSGLVEDLPTRKFLHLQMDPTMARMGFKPEDMLDQKEEPAKRKRDMSRSTLFNATREVNLLHRVKPVPATKDPKLLTAIRNHKFQHRIKPVLSDLDPKSTAKTTRQF